MHQILRPDDDGDVKVSDMEKKNMKKRFKNHYVEFPEDDEGFEYTKAAKIAGSN